MKNPWIKEGIDGHDPNQIISIEDEFDIPPLRRDMGLMNFKSISSIWGYKTDGKSHLTKKMKKVH